jgi:hypothetical protein
VANADSGPNGFVVGVRSDQQSPRHAYGLHTSKDWMRIAGEGWLGDRVELTVL